jgi:hypothetical protein
MEAKLKSRGPAALRGVTERQAVQAVNILAAATQGDEGNRTEKPNGLDERENSPVVEGGGGGVPESVGQKVSRKRRSKNEHNNTVRENRTEKRGVYTDEDVIGLLRQERRETERYSFEIYTDQKEDVQRVCDLYREKFGGYLSASRLIREVLDSFLPQALETFAKVDGENRS